MIFNQSWNLFSPYVLWTEWEIYVFSHNLVSISCYFPDFVFSEEEGIARIVLRVVFFALGILLMFLLAYIYCKLSPNSKTCTAWKLELHYYFMRIKYYYYYYTSSSKHTYG